MINEIAWMGTADNASDEWLELYNAGASSVDLEGWTLEWGIDSTTPKSIELSGSFAAHGYYLLERTDDSTLFGISADAIYTGSLSNSGEKLYLRSPSSIVQTLNFSAGWPAGDNTSKDTMQWSGTSWLTAPATPRATNSGAASPPAETAPPTNQSQPQSSASTSALTSVSLPETRSFTVNIGKDRTVSTDSAVGFGVAISPKSYESGVSVLWSFGDGARAEGLSVSHAYVLPGKYLANVKVSLGSDSAEARVLVNVVAQEVYISDAKDGHDGYIRLANKTETELRLGHYGLSAGSQLFSLPETFTVLPRSEVAIPARISGLSYFPKGLISLRSPDGELISTWSKESVPVPEVVGVSATATLPTGMLPQAEISKALSSVDNLKSSVLALSSSKTPDQTKKVIAVNDPVPTKALSTNTASKVKTEMTVKVVEIPRKSSWFGRLVSLPRRLVSSVISAI